MSNCFIIYSIADEKIADYIRQLLVTRNISVFMASVSLQAGQNWTKEIWSNLHQSKWVIFLASEDACNSPYVQQELSTALATEKNIIPVIWDMAPEKLPGWIKQKHALDLRGKSINEVGMAIKNIHNAIRREKKDQLILLILGIGVLMVLGSGK